MSGHSAQLFVLCVASVLLARGAHAQWVYQLPTDEESSACCLVATGDERVVISAGSTSGTLGGALTNNGGVDVLLYSTSEDARSGAVLGSILIGSSGDEMAVDLLYESSLSTVFVLGTTTGDFGGSSTGPRDMFIASVSYSFANAEFTLGNVLQGGTSGGCTATALMQKGDTIVGVGSGRSSGGLSDPTDQLVVLIVATDFSSSNVQVIDMVSGSENYFGVYSIAAGPGSLFAITSELAVVPSGAQDYLVIEYDLGATSISEQGRLQLTALNGALEFEGSSIVYSSAAERYAIAGVDPGFSNPFYENSAGSNPRFFQATMESGRTNYVATLRDRSISNNPVAPVAVLGTSTDSNAALMSYSVQRESDTRVAYATSVTSTSGNALGDYLSRANNTDDIVMDLNGFVFSDTTDFGVYYGSVAFNEENPYNCQGGPDRTDLLFNRMRVQIVGEEAVFTNSFYVTFSTLCSEVVVKAIESNNRYFAVGTTTGSIVPGAEANSDFEKTVMWSMAVTDTGTLPDLESTCFRPCESIAPPTPTPTATPTATPTSAEPSPGTPTPSATQTPGPTPTLGPLPAQKSASAGVIAGAIVGAIAGSAIVVGLASFIYWRKHQNELAQESGYDY